MAELPIMPLMTDALMADCGSMSDERFGQYMKLLICWWRDGCKPSTTEHLCELCGMDANAFAKHMRFLTETPDGWIQKKLFETYHRQIERKNKAKKSAQMRWRCERNANASPEQCERNASADAIHEPTVVYPSGYTTESAPAPEKRKSSTGSRLPSDWRPPPEFVDFAIGQGMTEKEVGDEANIFRDYWIAQPGAKGRKADWLATWRNWIRRSVERRRTPGPGRHSPGKLDDLRDVLDQAKEFDLAERKSVRDHGDGPERRAIGSG